MNGKTKPVQPLAIAKPPRNISPSTITFAIIMGILITIALSWNLTLWRPVPMTARYSWLYSQPGQRSYDTVNRTIFTETYGFGSLRRMSSPDPKGDWFYATRPIQSWSILEQKPTNPNQLLIEDARGWPLLALRATFTGKTTKPGTNWDKTSWTILTLHHGWRIKPHYQQYFDFEPFQASLALPFHPIYLNLIIDTIFWALIWLIIPYPIFFYSTYKYIRRSNRVKRNHCTICAYDLRGLSHKQCPECGTPIDIAHSIGNSFPKWTRPALSIALVIAVLTPLIMVWLNNQKPWTIIDAVKLHDEKAIRAAVARGVNVNVLFDLYDPGYPSTPLEMALDNNDVESVITLLQLGAADIFKKRSALSSACASGNPLLLHLVLSYGADPNDSLYIKMTNENWQIFALCIENGADPEMVQMMLDCGADLNPSPGKSCITPLIASMESARPTSDVTELLINAGADINAPSYERQTPGYTPLMEAVRGNNLQLIKQLIQLGADINTTTNYHQSALSLAIWTCNLESIQFLINHGATLKPFNYSGKLNLIHVLSNDDPQVFDYIITRPGIDINQADATGKTTLMYVVQSKGTDAAESVERLLDHGADPDAGDQTEWDILDLCASPEIRKLIQNAIQRKTSKIPNPHDHNK